MTWRRSCDSCGKLSKLDSCGFDRASGRRCFHEPVKVVFAQALTKRSITSLQTIFRPRLLCHFQSDSLVFSRKALSISRRWRELRQRRGVQRPSGETAHAEAISAQSERFRQSSGIRLYSVLGSGCCLFLVSAMSPASLAMTAWGLGGVFFVFLILIVLQRFGKLPSSSLGFLFSSARNRRDDGAADYEPRIAGQSRSSSMVGTNQPISANEAHEIKVTSANTWIPAKSGRNRKK